MLQDITIKALTSAVDNSRLTMVFKDTNSGDKYRVTLLKVETKNLDQMQKIVAALPVKLGQELTIPFEVLSRCESYRERNQKIGNFVRGLIFSSTAVKSSSWFINNYNLKEKEKESCIIKLWRKTHIINNNVDVSSIIKNYKDDMVGRLDLWLDSIDNQETKDLKSLLYIWGIDKNFGVFIPRKIDIEKIDEKFRTKKSKEIMEVLKIAFVAKKLQLFNTAFNALLYRLDPEFEIVTEKGEEE